MSSIRPMERGRPVNSVRFTGSKLRCCYCRVQARECFAGRMMRCSFICGRMPSRSRHRARRAMCPRRPARWYPEAWRGQSSNVVERVGDAACDRQIVAPVLGAGLLVRRIRSARERRRGSDTGCLMRADFRDGQRLATNWNALVGRRDRIWLCAACARVRRETAARPAQSFGPKRRCRSALCN